jgi:hypothetical protein
MIANLFIYLKQFKMQKLPQIDQLKLEKLKHNLDLVTEMSTILLNIQENKYTRMKNNLNTYEKEAENYTTQVSSSDNVRDLFFNEILPIFIKNMNIYVAFRDKQENEKDSISILNIPFLVKLTTKNMLLHLLMLTNYKSLLIENVIKIKDMYNNEMSMLFNNLNFESLVMQIDKELAVNVVLKKQNKDPKFTNLQRVYEDVFEYMNSSFENNKFNEIFSTMTDLTQKLRNMIDPKQTIQRDLKEIIKTDESELDATQLAYFQNQNTPEINSQNIYQMITSLNGTGDEDSKYQFLSRVNKRTYSSDDEQENYGLVPDAFLEQRLQQSMKNNQLSDLFKSLKLKLSNLQDVYFHQDINKEETKFKFDSTWEEIKSIYEKFDNILVKLIQDTNKITSEYFSPYEANADILTFLKKIDDDNIYKYLAFDNNISKATSAIMNSLPFQNFIIKHINDCSIIIQDYLRQHEKIEKMLISNKVLIASITTLQLNSFKNVNATFPLINFLPLKMAYPFFELFHNFNIDKLFYFIKTELESKHLFVSLCGFVLTPVEKLILIAEERDTKLFNNRKMIEMMQNSYEDTIKNLFKFVGLFIYEIQKILSRTELKSLYYYNLLKVSETKNRNFIDQKNKEISTQSKEFEKYPFSYENCISSIFHNAVAHSHQYKQSLLLVQTFFGMVEPIFILSCLMNLNENYLKLILLYLSEQISYEIINEERKEMNQIPKLLESYLIRFLVFYLLLSNEVKLISSNGETISLEIKNENRFLNELFISIKKKSRIIDKCALFGVLIQDESSMLIKRNNFEQSESEKVFTVKEEFFQMKTELPNILDFLSTNTGEVKANHLEKFSNNNNIILEKTECLRIAQQLDQSILGGISIQSIEMNDFNYVMNNLNFKEKFIQIKLT